MAWPRTARCALVPIREWGRPAREPGVRKKAERRRHTRNGAKTPADQSLKLSLSLCRSGKPRLCTKKTRRAVTNWTQAHVNGRYACAICHCPRAICHCPCTIGHGPRAISDCPCAIDNCPRAIGNCPCAIGQCPCAISRRSRAIGRLSASDPRLSCAIDNCPRAIGNCPHAHARYARYQGVERDWIRRRPRPPGRMGARR